MPTVFLSYNSYHPGHTFRSVVYCQGMRYRRIINRDSLLKDRLAQLKAFFIRSGYPVKLVTSILNDVSKKPRVLDYVSRDNSKPFITPWVVTYGPGFDEAKKFENEVNELLSYSSTWKDKDENVEKIVHVVPRRAPNLKDLLFKRKSLACVLPTAVGVPSQRLATCNVSGCLTCKLVDPAMSLYHNNNQINTAGGNCKSWNVVYCFQCKLCNILYVGKTIDPLHERVNGHRSKFYYVVRHSGLVNEDCDDEQIVGAHLVHFHNLKSKDDFNSSYRIFILAHVNPTSLRKTEQSWIDKLRTHRPFGLNKNNSVG